MNVRAAWRDGVLASWRWLRSVSGDDAYERYLVHLHSAHPERPLPTRREFYLDEQQRRWTGVNRCC